MQKRVLSGLLSLAMLLTLTPMAAFASEPLPNETETLIQSVDSHGLPLNVEKLELSEQEENDSAMAESAEGTSAGQTVSEEPEDVQQPPSSASLDLSGPSSISMEDEPDLQSTDNFCGENVTWTLKNGVLTIAGEGVMEGYNAISSICPPWYDQKDSITSIVIESGVTEIGKEAFFACASVEEVTLPEGLTKIGMAAFKGCEALTSVEIPASVKTIGGEAFNYCKKLSSVTFQDGRLETIGSVAFSNCALTEVTIPASVKKLEMNAFKNATLTTVTFEGTPTTIHAKAFTGCDALVKVIVPDASAEVFGKVNGFADKLEAAEPPAPAETHIATYVDEAPEGLNGDFSVPYSTVKATDVRGAEYTVEVVPRDLVYFIDQIDYNSGTVSKPYEAVKTLVPDLLNDKYDQQKGNGDTWGLVSGLDAGKSNVDVSAKNLTGLYGNNRAGNTLVYALPLEAGKYTITTGHHEWWGGQNRSMDLSLTTEAGTEKYASLPKMDNGQDCQAKYSFELPAAQTVTLTITAIGNQGPVISWLGVVRDGDYEAPDDNIVAQGECGDQGSNVTWVLTKDGTLTISGTGAMKDFSDYAVPWKDYRNATTENKITSIVIEQGVTHIGNNAFYFCQGVTGKVMIPEGVTSIGNRAFYEAKFMTGLELPSTLKTIANSAFSGCRALEELNLPDGLTSIGQEAFNYCRALTSLRIPESVTDVGNKAFANCDRLKYAVLSIDIGSSMFDKGNYVDDLQLATVSIAKGTTGIGYAAFSNCKNLSAIIVDAETLNNLCTSKNGTNHLPGANYPSSPSFSAAYYVIGDSVDASVLTELSKATAIKVCGADAQVDVETLRVVVNGQEVTEWEAKEDGTQVPKVEKPDPVVPVLGDALEDNNGLTLTQNASLIDAENKDLAQMLKLSTDWNDKNQGHASIPDVSAFKSGAFTVILDVQPDSSLSTETWKRTALTIGNKENKLRLLNAAGLLGYGADQTNDGKSNGTCKDWKTRIFGGFTVTSRQFYIAFHKIFLIRRAGRLFTFYCWPQRVMEGGPQHDLN